MEESSTADLLREWHSGSRAALQRLLERDRRWIESCVRRQLGDHLRRKAETGDFVQLALIQVIESGPRFIIQDRDHFRRLVARMVRNAICDEHDRFGARKRDIKRERPIPRDTILDLDSPIRAVERPSQIADRNEQHAWVRLALEFLDDDTRSIVHRHLWDGWSFAEIAEELASANGRGVTGAAVQKRYQRALPRLAVSVRRIRSGQIEELLVDVEGAQEQG